MPTTEDAVQDLGSAWGTCSRPLATVLQRSCSMWTLQISASKDSIRRFVITEKALRPYYYVLLLAESRYYRFHI